MSSISVQNQIKAQTQENPSQVKQIKKDYHDFMEKYKKEMKEKDEKLEEMTKKVMTIKIRENKISKKY